MSTDSKKIEALPLSDKYWDFFKELIEKEHTSGNPHLEKLINLYFGKGSKCLKCQKGKIIKDKEDDTYVMHCGDKCSWNIKFEPPRTVNLYAQLTKYKRLSDSHSQKLRLLIEKKQLNTVDDFKELEESYKDNQKLLKLSNDNIEKIQNILNEGKIALRKIIEEKFKLSHELFLLSTKRTESYSKIKTMITEEKLDQIKKVFKNEGIPKESEILRVAKVINSDEADVHNWLEWLSASKKYIELQEKVNSLDNELKDMKSRTLYLNQNYPVHKGKIHDNIKNIKRITINTKSKTPDMENISTNQQTETEVVTVPRNKKVNKTKKSSKQ